MKRRKYGLSFIELIIALGLLAFLIFSIALLIPLSHTRTQSISDKDTAYNLADAMLEKIRALGFDDIIEGKTYNGCDPANKGTYYQYPPVPYPKTSVTAYYPQSNSTAIIARSTNYTFSVLASLDVDKSGNEIRDLKKVKVTVSWKKKDATGGSQDCSITLSSKMLRR
jgi:type II secretory pathway pseudopilin PulG